MGTTHVKLIKVIVPHVSAHTSRPAKKAALETRSHDSVGARACWQSASEHEHDGATHHRDAPPSATNTRDNENGAALHAPRRPRSVAHVRLQSSQPDQLRLYRMVRPIVRTAVSTSAEQQKSPA